MTNSITDNPQGFLKTIDGEIRVSHRVIADNTKNKHNNIVELINKYKNKFEQIDGIPFKTECPSEVKLKQKTNPDYRANKTYWLNEQQSSFLMTLLRNDGEDGVVVNFKFNLVNAFFKMKEILQNNSDKETVAWALYQNVIENEETRATISIQKELVIKDLQYKLNDYNYNMAVDKFIEDQLIIGFDYFIKNDDTYLTLDGIKKLMDEMDSFFRQRYFLPKYEFILQDEKTKKMNEILEKQNTITSLQEELMDEIVELENS